jgi:tetratricopeptide (TPR) repeat protein
MVIFCEPILNAADADILWNEAVANVKEGENDFAFINFHMLVETCPDYRKRSAAEFSLGEYYFTQKNYRSAIEEFEKLYTAYPKCQEALIAMAYLYKIAREAGRNDAADEYRKKMIVARPVSFIFKDKESLRYLSGFQHKYNVVRYIDRIEILMDGKLFVEVRN